MICNRCIHNKVCSGYDIHNCANFFEIVMCKDCKFWHNKHLGNIFKDYGLCEMYGCFKKKDGFCDSAERKETE